MPKGPDIKQMFAGIAGRYDLANHLLSLGIDYYWRRRLVREVKASRPKSVVDLATGSGDVAFALKKELDHSVKIKGIDFCEPMLAKANEKKSQNKDFQDIEFILGDVLHLPLADNSVDALTIAFGFRNLEDRAKGLREMRRVLSKPNGVLLILEFTQTHPWFRPLYSIYLKYILPILAYLITGESKAYHYLAGSIESFPTKKLISEQIAEAGFKNIKSQSLSFSIVAIHRAET